MKYTPGKPSDYVTEIKETNGKEYMYLTGEEYKGYYHMYMSVTYTGATHDKYSKELIKYNPNKNYVNYLNLNDFYLKEGYKSIKGYYPVLEEKDYERGNFTRYFVRKRNDTSAPIIEIDKKQFETLNQSKSGLNESIYKGVKLIWKLTGPRNDVYKDGKIVIYGVEDSNKRTLKLKEREMENITTALRSLTQFARLK